MVWGIDWCSTASQHRFCSAEPPKTHQLQQSRWWDVTFASSVLTCQHRYVQFAAYLPRNPSSPFFKNGDKLVPWSKKTDNEIRSRTNYFIRRKQRWAFPHPHYTPDTPRHANSSVPTHISRYTFSFSYREVRSPKVRNKFREDVHFPSVEHSGIFSEKALCP